MSVSVVYVATLSLVDAPVEASTNVFELSVTVVGSIDVLVTEADTAWVETEVTSPAMVPASEEYGTELVDERVFDESPAVSAVDGSFLIVASIEEDVCEYS